MAMISPKGGDSLPSSRESSQDNQVFSIRIVNLDYYMGAPLPEMDVGYSSFQGRSIEEVPVIRIFGSTTAGQKTCLHLHKAFPYLYVPYDEDLPQEVNEAFVYVRRLAVAIEQAMKMSSHANGKKQHVHSCSLVRGKKFYGFHPSEQLFIKIVLYYPKEVSRISTLLLAGGILNRKFQPHESHIPYLLQFLIDHNLSGMGHIHLPKVKFRPPVPDKPLNRAPLLKTLKESFMYTPSLTEGDNKPSTGQLQQLELASVLPSPNQNPAASSSMGSELHIWLKGNIPGGWIWPDNLSASGDTLSRHSTCELEVDASAEDILNKRDLLFMPLQSTGREVKMVQSLTSIWEEELQRTGDEGAAGALTQSTPRERVLPPISAHEQALRAALLDIICQYKASHSLTPDIDDNILSRSPVPASEQAHMDRLMVRFEVEEGKVNPVLPSPEPVGDANPNPQVNPAVYSLQNEHLLPGARGSLSLKFTQAANAQQAAEVPDGDGAMQAQPVQMDEEGLVNEEIVRNQFSQTSEFQGTEKEVLDLLCWMGAAQDNLDVDAAQSEDESGCEKVDLSQIVCSSGVQAALTKALSVYEGASNAECQEILDCFGDADSKEPNEMGSPEEGAQGQNMGDDEAVDQDVNDIEEFETDPKRCRTTFEEGTSKGSYYGPNIPQIDGQFDDAQDGSIGEDELLCQIDSVRRQGEAEPLRLPKSESESPSPLLEMSDTRKTSGRLPTVKYPVSKATVSKLTVKPKSSWCALPLVGADCKPTISRQKTDKAVTTNARERLLGDGHTTSTVEALAVQNTAIKEKADRSLRDLMRRRRIRKQLKRDTTSKDPTVMHERERRPAAATSDHQCNKINAEKRFRSSSDTKKRKLPVSWEDGLDGKGDHRDCGGGRGDSRNSTVLHRMDKRTSMEVATLESGLGTDRLISPGRTSESIACQDDEGTVPQLSNLDLNGQPALFTAPVRVQESNGETILTKVGDAAHHCQPSNEKTTGRALDAKKDVEEGVSCTKPDLYTQARPQRHCSHDRARAGSGFHESLEVKSFNDGKDGIQNAVTCAVQFSSAETKSVLSNVTGNANVLCDKQDAQAEFKREDEQNLVKTDRRPFFPSAFRAADTLLSNQNPTLVEGNALRELQVYQEHPEGRLFPLSLIKKPPSPAHCLETLSNYSLKSKDHGRAFYGNIKDVPAQQTVMAGLIFDLKSNQGKHLSPFVFGVPGKVSRSDQDSRTRNYVEKELWGLHERGDHSMGIPVHFENDGSIYYLLSPARSPPSKADVLQWLQEKKSKDYCGTYNLTKGIFTMDSNTGSLVALADTDGTHTQDTQTFTQGFIEDNGYFRPASPKYDEKHVLAMPVTFPPSTESFDKASGVHLAGKVIADVNGHLNTSEIVQSLVLQAQPLAQEKLERVGETHHHKKHRVSFELSEDVAAVRKDTAKCRKQVRDISQITGPSVTTAHTTPLSQCGFRDPASLGGGQQVTLASIEVLPLSPSSVRLLNLLYSSVELNVQLQVHADTRGDLRPDPRYDAVGCIVVVFQNDYMPQEESIATFVLVRDETAWRANKNLDGLKSCDMIYLPNEVELLNFFVRLVKLYDADILLGWEIQGFSLGLLAERAANLGISLLKQLSRTHVTEDGSLNAQHDVQGIPENLVFGGVQIEKNGVQEPIIDDEWGRTHGSGIYVGGRTVLNLWRIMRGEVKLGIYSLEAVAEIVLRRRVPRIPWRTLTHWFHGGPGKQRFRCLEYFVDRARLNFMILDQLDLLSRTAELARIFGIEFFSVFSRGSQYRVESMLLRLAHTQNYLMISPSKQQVAAQPAMECLPLVMEPESRFYTSPVVVLDFQSLYPSMIIAYNLCFSTCLGKIVSKNPKELGVTSLYVPPALLSELKDQLTLTPNGVMYAPPEVRRGVLPRLLDEILSTRIMVKKTMKKLSQKERVRQRVLNARQFALKLIANVTYGYTAAGFSGRMPCAELADSIVQCGRITLERAIHQVNSHPDWGARVVYGDTDSMFVLLEGRTREEAFKIGQEIASAVTAANPPPVVLKMEKVYHPCVLLTKKRYVGYSYESPRQTKPTFDAKGIETVRRDSCPAVGKTMERSLRILFESKDLSKVKRYLQRQWGKVLSGRISIRDFIFAKEVRLGTYSAKASVLPPAAIVASKAMSADPRAEPRYGERIPYVVIHGEPGSRLVDMVVDPHILLNNPLALRLHDTYYITKQIIPSLQRIFGLLGVDLKLWYNEMPRVYQAPSKKPAASAMLPPRQGLEKGASDILKLQQRANCRATIDNYYLSRHCAVCGAFTRGSTVVCTNCSKDARLVSIVTTGRASQLEKELRHLEAICRHCGGDDGNPERRMACVSLDCPVFFERRKADKELQATSATATRWNQSTRESELF